MHAVEIIKIDRQSMAGFLPHGLLPATASSRHAHNTLLLSDHPALCVGEIFTLRQKWITRGPINMSLNCAAYVRACARVSSAPAGSFLCPWAHAACTHTSLCSQQPMRHEISHGGESRLRLPGIYLPMLLLLHRLSECKRFDCFSIKPERIKWVFWHIRYWDVNWNR
jgi:hypothetical protein